MLIWRILALLVYLHLVGATEFLGQIVRLAAVHVRHFGLVEDRVKLSLLSFARLDGDLA